MARVACKWPGSFCRSAFCLLSLFSGILFSSLAYQSNFRFGICILLNQSSATILTNSFQFLTEGICYDRESLSKFRMNIFHCLLLAYFILILHTWWICRWAIEECPVCIRYRKWGLCNCAEVVTIDVWPPFSAKVKTMSSIPVYETFMKRSKRRLC